MNEIVQAHKNGKTPNITGIKTRISKKYKLPTQPRLTDIIAAIPEEHKQALLPLLRAKPVRTASGIAVSLIKYL